MHRTQLAFPAIVTIALLIITGCSSNLSKKECLNADWRLIGLEDGSQGYPLARIGRHRQACAQVDVVPDQQQYQAGLNEGYKTYCTRANGYNIGVAGKSHHSVCTGQTGSAFLRAFNDGHQLHRLRVELVKLQNAIKSRHKDIASAQHAIADYEEQLIYAPTTSDERRHLLEHMRELEQHRDELLMSLDLLLIEQRDLQQSAKELQEHHQQLGYR